MKRAQKTTMGAQYFCKNALAVVTITTSLVFSCPRCMFANSIPAQLVATRVVCSIATRIRIALPRTRACHCHAHAHRHTMRAWPYNAHAHGYDMHRAEL